MSREYHECYSDPTAAKAISAVMNEERKEAIDANYKLMQCIRSIVDIAGFEIVGRITLKHKKSGRIFK